MAINKMVKDCYDVNGISGLELDDQNDTVVRGVFEVAMNCDARGNQLDQEYVLVKMPKSLYETTCIANPIFRDLDMYGGQWDELENDMNNAVNKLKNKYGKRK